MVVVGGAWIYLQDTTLPVVNDGAINIYIIHFVAIAPSAGFISVLHWWEVSESCLKLYAQSYLYSSNCNSCEEDHLLAAKLHWRVHLAFYFPSRRMAQCCARRSWPGRNHPFPFDRGVYWVYEIWYSAEVDFAIIPFSCTSSLFFCGLLFLFLSSIMIKRRCEFDWLE